MDINEIHDIILRRLDEGVAKKYQNPEGGLNAKGRAHFKRTEGANLKPPVSKKAAKKSPKKASRRKSFCARMGGQKRMHNVDCRKDPDKDICKALRKWDCNESYINMLDDVLFENTSIDNTYIHNGTEYTKICRKCASKLEPNLPIEPKPPHGNSRISRADDTIMNYRQRMIGRKCNNCIENEQIRRQIRRERREYQRSLEKGYGSEDTTTNFRDNRMVDDADLYWYDRKDQALPYRRRGQ